jgi:hypothetical protein
MKRIFLALAIFGAIVPYVFFIPYFGEFGVAYEPFFAAMGANGISAGFSADLMISSAVFWIWIIRSRTPRPWIYILLNLTIGLSCALPAWLYSREVAAEGA